MQHNKTQVTRIDLDLFHEHQQYARRKAFKEDVKRNLFYIATLCVVYVGITVFTGL